MCHPQCQPDFNPPYFKQYLTTMENAQVKFVLYFFNGLLTTNNVIRSKMNHHKCKIVVKF